MNKTNISWCDWSSNPIKYRRKSDGKIVWGCVRVSDGCKNCYSEAVALRFDRGKLFNARNMEELEVFLDEAELRQMLTKKAITGKRVFVADMTDALGEWVPDEMLDRLFATMALRPDVTWQVLTKRAERMRGYFSGPALERVQTIWHDMRYRDSKVTDADWDRGAFVPWPLPNVWLGVSVENQEYADKRIPLLLQTPAAVRYLSVEPLLGPVNLKEFAPFCWKRLPESVRQDMIDRFGPNGLPANSLNAKWGSEKIKWLIVGGESGKGHRLCEVEWIADIVRQCEAAAVSVHVKQDSGPRPGTQGRIPLSLWNRKEFPEAAHA